MWFTTKPKPNRFIAKTSALNVNTLKGGMRPPLFLVTIFSICSKITQRLYNLARDGQLWNTNLADAHLLSIQTRYLSTNYWHHLITSFYRDTQ